MTVGSSQHLVEAGHPWAYDRQSKLVVGRGNEVLLSHNDMSVLELQPDPAVNSMAKVVLVATSHSQTKLATVLDSGMVWLGTLARKLTSHQLEVVPTGVA